MKTKATRCRMISCFAQIINEYVLGYKIPKLVKNEKIKARKFSYDSQIYLLMLGQFLHVFSLNELADISNIYAKEHDSKKEEILFESLNAGDIGILDRAYNNFETLYKQSQRGVIFVVREKEAMLHEVVESVSKDKLAKNIIADEIIRLTGLQTKKSYPTTLRRVTAHVEINGHWHDLTFLTNNFEWAASTIAELYKAR